MSGLQDYHHAEDKPDRTQKIVTWVVLALVVGGITFYAIEQGMLSPHPQQAGQSYPRGL
jgi:hypothetical protein